jgi:hypothetical protein
MEFYHGNYVDAVVFHDYPYCERACPGCYLAVHVERMARPGGWRPALPGLNAWRQAWNDLQTGALDFRCNQLIYCAQNETQLSKQLCRIRDIRSKACNEIQVLATRESWKDAVDVRHDIGIIKSVSVDRHKTPKLMANTKISGMGPFRFRVWNILWTDNRRDPQWEDRMLHLAKHGIMQYLVAPKPITGEVVSRDNLLAIDKLIEFWEDPKREKHKNFRLDYCLNKIKYGDKSTACRAGVNMFNIHIDGAITACPYSGHVAAWLQDFNNVAEAIRYVRSNTNKDPEDWNICNMRHAYENR